MMSSTSTPATDSAESPRTPDAQQILMDSFGGVSGMIYSAIPVVVFVAAHAAVSLPIAIGAALAVAAVTAVWRIARKERVSTAIGGVIGVAVAGGVAAWTGSADGYFLIGIWAGLAGAVITIASLVARRPLTGLLWNALHGRRHAWRADPSVLRAHDIATLTLAVLFSARFVVQQALYESEATGWLAFAKVAMGTPLLAVALVVVVWAFRRSSKRLTD
ncbi:DUF3159 domain-containing protein [Gordonia soli]|uniref:DUF3159 domain-containing protein n=1 Tax=Gordonia soli NBRC 108243 TaxID=1223545 RepID=M0QJV9_9ACTN|nr:DUF3159 domain-containing protein [Gordonia soli]GAC67727.1 hypothetical protein GS4_09_00410 [Gordonia soli NBRC 108243]